MTLLLSHMLFHQTVPVPRQDGTIERTDFALSSTDALGFGGLVFRGRGAVILNGERTRPQFVPLSFSSPI